MTDYYCENCEFFRDKSKDKLIFGYCKKYNCPLNFYDWWEKCDKCVIDALQAENATLRERLDKAVERLKAREQSVYFGLGEWKAVVTDKEIDEVFGVTESSLEEPEGGEE